MPATVLRPVFFMTNRLFLANISDSGERVLSMPLDSATPVQMISANGIGFFAATALDAPQEFIGEQIEIIGNELSLQQVAEAFQRVTGTPTRYEAAPLEGRTRMFEWFEEGGYQADIRPSAACTRRCGQSRNSCSASPDRSRSGTRCAAVVYRCASQV